MERTRRTLVTAIVAVLVAAAGTLGGSLISAGASSSPGAESSGPSQSGSDPGPAAVRHGRHCHHGDRGGPGPSQSAPDTSGTSGSPDYSF